MTIRTYLLSAITLLLAGTASAQDARSSINESRSDYGNNILSFSPLQVSDRGVGFALSYERVLDKNRNLVSFYFPITAALNNFNNDDYQTYYFMPGIKIYPTGGKGVIRYGVGPNITYATGKMNVQEQLLDPSGGFIGTKMVEKDFYKLGMMITNSLNVNPTKRLHMGLELGLGFTYLDNIDDNSFSSDGPFNLAQFGFKVGYRF
jgi:hypothetical protein